MYRCFGVLLYAKVSKTNFLKNKMFKNVVFYLIKIMIYFFMVVNALDIYNDRNSPLRFNKKTEANAIT